MTDKEYQNKIDLCEARNKRLRDELEILHKSWKILLKIEVDHAKEIIKLRKKLGKKQ